ncbi:MAG TPA: LiaF domain-containing protein [Gemmatimonadaceae bacterium]|nr:LiaF domain-containing protein [Gemmatimonadaceae bacterium]
MPDYKAEDHRLTSPLDPPRDYTEQGAQLVPETPAASGVVSFLSSTEREGRWQLPRRFRALAVLGNVEIDLRAAEIGYGLSTIEAVAVLGNIEITVSPDIMVECDGDSLLGSFVLKYDGRANPAAASRDKVIRVTGTAYAGAVTVMVKGPDETMMAKLSRTMGWGPQ